MPPPEMILDALLYAFAPALVVAAALFALVEWLGGKEWAPLGSALGLTIGMTLSLWLRGALALTSSDSAWNHLPLAAAALLAIGLASRSQRVPRIVAWLVRTGCVASAAWWVIPAAEQADAWWLAPGFAAITLAEWVLLEHLASKPPNGTPPFCLALTAFFAVPVLIQAASGSGADAATVLAAALGGVAAVAWLRSADADAVVPGAAMFLNGILLAGQRGTFTDVPWAAFLLVAVAPLSLILTLTARRFTGVTLLLLRIVVLLPLLVAALGLAGLPNFDELM